jgi:hypothetical protein
MQESIEKKEKRKGQSRLSKMMKFLRSKRKTKIKIIIITKALLKIPRLIVKKMQKRETYKKRKKEDKGKRKKKLESEVSWI